MIGSRLVIGTRLDGVLLRRGAYLVLMVTGVMLLAFVGVDLVASASTLVNSSKRALVEEGSSTGALLIKLYWNRLPVLLGIALPTAAVIAALVICAPMLRRGEFVALEAVGVSSRRVVAPTLVLALLIGLVDAAIADLVAPHAQARALAIEDLLQGQKKVGRVWREETTGVTWFADRAALVGTATPVMTSVVVAAKQELVLAERVSWDGARWSASGEVVRVARDGVGRSDLVRLRSLELVGDLRLPHDPDDLFRRLLPRYTMTGPELAARGERADTALLASRWSRIFVPLLCLLVAIPVFVRFQYKDAIVVGAVRGALAGMVPALIVVVGGMVADNTPGSPFVAIVVSLALAAVPGWWCWSRWRL